MMITENNTFALATILILVVCFAVYAQRFKWGQFVSAALIALFLGMILSNLGVIPFTAPVYSIAIEYLIPVAIPLLLFKSNLRSLFSETGALLILFLFAALGTILGAILGLWLLPLGPDSTKIMGTLAATYIGGSVNFVTVSEILELNDPTLLSATIAADNVTGTFYLACLTLMATSQTLHNWFSKPVGHLESESAAVNALTSTKSFDWRKLALLLVLSILIFLLANFITSWLSMERFHLLFVTMFAVIIANLFPGPLQTIKGDFELGMFFMYIFFTVIGAGSNISLLVSYGSLLLGYALLICLTHFLVIAIFAKIFHFRLAEVITVSNACILGPVTAMALAAHNRWIKLISPALLCGLFGYVIANIIGISVALWLAK